MDENQTPRPEEEDRLPGIPEETASPERDFQLQREKKIEKFVLDLDEDVVGPDPEPDAAQPQDTDDQTNELSSFSGAKPPRNKKPRAMVRRKKHSGMYRLLYFCAVLAVSVLLARFLVAGAYDLLGATREPGEVEVIIEPDMDDDAVVDQLVKAGVVKNTFFFKLYAKVTKAKFNPGTYVLERNADYELINNSLLGTANRIDTVKLTFIEGGTLEEFAKQLESAKVCGAADFIKAVNEEDFSNYSFIADIPNAKDRAYLLEGYLFPDTYEFYQYENPKTAARRFLNNLNMSKLTKEVYDRAKELDMTIDQVLTLASIIQKESGNPEDMYKISSVFHNRLNGWGAEGKLQSDVTYLYQQTLPEQYAGLYDTYICSGLPAGPVCNPGMKAIEAALYPSKTNYFYFVADANGKTYYARTLAEHEKNIAYAEKVKPAASQTASGTAGD